MLFTFHINTPFIDEKGIRLAMHDLVNETEVKRFDSFVWQAIQSNFNGIFSLKLSNMLYTISL